LNITLNDLVGLFTVHENSNKILDKNNFSNNVVARYVAG